VRLPHIERLENRFTMAGNVTAALVGTDLVITGDTSANAISVVETVNDGEFTITGLNDGSGSPTSVNGTPNGSATIAGVTGDIVVNLLDGADSVTVISANHSGNLTIDAGAGDDSVALGEALPVSFSGNVTVHCGDGAARFVATQLTVGGDLLVDEGVAAGSTAPHSYALVNSNVGNDAILRLGDRAGAIDVTGSNVLGTLHLDNFNFRPIFTSPTSPRVSDVYTGLRVTDSYVGTYLRIESVTATLVDVSNTYIAGASRIEGSGNNNLFQVRNSSVLGNLTITTLQGTAGPFPSVSRYDVVVLSGVVGNTLDSSTSSEISVFYSGFSGNATIGTNLFNTILFNTNLFRGDLTIRSGSGDDTIDVRNSVISGTLSMTHQGGQQGFSDFSSVMTVVNNRIGTLSIGGGNATDVVAINYSLIDHIFANLGDGSDSISVTGSIANVDAQFEGGPGFDLFRNSGSVLNGWALANFEAF
jgi:hypothetical protein